MAEDPLSLLRKAVMAERNISLEDGYYVLESHRFHESTLTSFRRTHKSGGYYTLRDVIFCLENDGRGIPEYRSKATSIGVTAVVVNDLQDLRNYLTGQIETCTQIDSSEKTLATTQDTFIPVKSSMPSTSDNCTDR